MSDTIRAFIAVKITANDSLRGVAAALRNMGSAVKAVSPDNLHVTLKFLGDTDTNLIPQIAKILEAAVSGSAACPLCITGLGAFPNPHRPTVVWAGLENAGTLAAIATQLEEQLAGLGFPPERRPFQPHLTLARVKFKPPPVLRKLIEQHRSHAFGTEAVNSVELLQSELRSDGPRYTCLATVRFADENSTDAGSRPTV